MNEKIRELMEKASSNACYDEPNQLHLMNDEIQKFAELLIQKCDEIVSNGQMNAHPWHYGLMIKQYFGAE